MKTYLCVGIGDMVHLDSILETEEKASISEIYWATRWGPMLSELFDGNKSYPNLIRHYVISDAVGKNAMKFLDPIAVPFWHFRPDFPTNFKVGLNLFGIENDWENGSLQVFNALKMFSDPKRTFKSSSFIKSARPVNLGDYIFFHYPTSTRPRTDICEIVEEDWDFVNWLAIEKNMKVVIASDSEINIPLKCDFVKYINPELKFFVDLAASCKFFVGCDSFGAHLATKHLPKENLFIKTHDPNIKQKLMEAAYCKINGLEGRHRFDFCPHPPEDVALFYKNYIGFP